MGDHSITDWTAMLNGEIGRDDQGELVIRAPGEGHSPQDRSLAVWLDEDAPQGFRVHSFADDDPIRCRDYVSRTVGLPRWEPAKANGYVNGHAKPHAAHREIVAQYVYAGMDGDPVLRVTRYAPKKFSQSRPVGSGWEPGGVALDKLVPYRLPEFTEAGATGQTVYVTEGEKAADKLWGRGLAATCSPMGALKWRDQYAPWFKGFSVIVLADNDQPGRDHAAQVKTSLEGVAADVRIINLPGLLPGADVADWIDGGNDPATIPNLPSGPPRRGHSAAVLWSMPFPPVKFIVTGHITEGLTLLAGAPKRGKSWLALDFCCMTAKGGHVLDDRYCPEGDVLYCALEDSPRRIKDRLHKQLSLSKGGPARLDIWFGPDLPRLGSGCEEALREWIESKPEPRLIVIDTLNYIRPERVREEDPYSYDYRSASALQRIAIEYRLGIIIVHHTRKTPTDDYLESVSGTNGLTGGCDAVVVLEKASDGTTVLKGRGRDVEEFETTVRFDKEGCRWRVVSDAADARMSETRISILATLRDTGWFMSVPDIVQQTGCNRTTIAQALVRMVKEGIVIRGARGQYGLPPEVIEGGGDGERE